MEYWGDDLQQLKEKTVRKNRLETELRDLYVQKTNLAGKLKELEKIKLAEQKDVDRLEGGSLASFFYNVIGKREEKLTREKEEAYKAAVKYETAKEELNFVENEIFHREEELKRLEGCEETYANAFEEKLKKVRSSGTEEAEQVMQLETKRYQLECEKKELEEALLIGRQALKTVNEVLDSLDDAEGWATWDTFGGGGLLIDLMKHDYLDEAQTKINTLQVELRKFKTELSDVKIHADIQVQIEEFLKFADYFFDGLFADWAVMDKIEQSVGKVNQTQNEVLAIIESLKEKLKEVENQDELLRKVLEQLILQDRK